MVQVPTGNNALAKLIVPDPAVAPVTEPPQLFTRLGMPATNRLPGTVPTLVGRLSVKLAFIGTTLPLVILKVIVLGVLVFTTLVPLKLLVIEGGCRITILAFAVPPLDGPKPDVLAV